MTPATPQPTRRGRPRAGEQQARRQRVLDAAFEELVEQGYERLTMSAIAARASASKETLYRWFGSREGLFTTMIQTNADASAARVANVLETVASPVDTLTSYATGLLTLLTSRQSVALNRAAMASPQLAQMLLESGRHRIGPLVEGYLSGLEADGYLAFDSAADAFRLLYGLTVQDTQIRVLLGEQSPSADAISRQAGEAVRQFLELTQPGQAPLRR